MNTILYTVAQKVDGEHVFAPNAEKSHSYYCPHCNGEFVLRKSGNVGKNSKRPHFAHKILTPNCTPETALHFLFKKLLATRIQNHIDSGTPMFFSWDCQFCNSMHSGNLIKKAKEVKLEHNLKTCIPDIILIDNNDKIFAAIEIVVTHKPEPETIKYYKENNIILIQFNLISGEAIEKFEETISKPDKLTYCSHPKCKKCNNHKSSNAMTIVNGNCWKCSANMKVAIMHGGIGRGGNNVGPKYFTKSEIKLAQTKGVLITEQNTIKFRRSYLANTCKKCNSFVGEHHLYIDYLVYSKSYEYISTGLGYHCDCCDDFDVHTQRGYEKWLIEMEGQNKS